MSGGFVPVEHAFLLATSSISGRVGIPPGPSNACSTGVDQDSLQNPGSRRGAQRNKNLLAEPFLPAFFSASPVRRNGRIGVTSYMVSPMRLLSPFVLLIPIFQAFAATGPSLESASRI